MRDKKTIYLVAAVILLSGLVFGMSVGRDAEVIFSNLQWDCHSLADERYCDVSFNLLNKTSAPQVRKINVRGIRAFSDKKDENVQTCGELIFSILLEPHEGMAIHEIMPVVAMPDKIKILIWE